MTTTVKIDLNVRVAGDRTFSSISDASGPLVMGQRVTVVEPESGLSGVGWVYLVDCRKDLVYLDVDWGSLA